MYLLRNEERSAAPPAMVFCIGSRIHSNIDQSACPGCAHPGLQATQSTKAALAVQLPHTSQLTGMLICARHSNFEFTFLTARSLSVSSELAVSSKLFAVEAEMTLSQQLVQVQYSKQPGQR
jgi:hypothetical protein